MLADRLAAAPVLLGDGAMASNLYEMGLPLEAPPELWLERHPARVLALHRAFLEAGAGILLTNTFGANAVRLAALGWEGRVAALNRRAAALARQAVAAKGGAVLVAGAVGPTGQSLAQAGRLAEAACAALFAEQMQALAEGGVDLVWIETMSDPAEMRAAVQAAARLGLPCVLTASFSDQGCTLAGLTAAGFRDFVAALLEPPLAIGANCGSGPASVLRVLPALAGRLPVVARPNAGLPARQGDRLAYPVTPADMAAFARQAVQAGARLVGGCCGTGPDHIAAMRAALAAADGTGPRVCASAATATSRPGAGRPSRR